MNATQRVFRYEERKFFYDKGRLWFFILSLLGTLSLVLLITFLWLGNGSGGSETKTLPWNEETATQIAQMRAYYYEQYLIASGKLPLPSGQIIIPDSTKMWREYQYCDFLLQVKNLNFFSNFSTTGRLFSIDCLSQDYPYLSSSRMLFYQDIVFIVLPLFLGTNIFYTFLYDKSLKIDKNYRIFGIKKSSFGWGKVFFSFLFFLLVLVFFMLFGLIFTSNTQMIIYDGTFFHAESVVAIYFERWLEIAIVLTAFFDFFILLAIFTRKSGIYIPLMIVVSLFLFPLFYNIKESLVNTPNQQFLATYPFYNVVSSNGFLDGGILSRLAWPLLVIGCSVFFFLAFIYGKSLLKKLKTHQKINRIVK